jgi:D-cysteine desulfhydrase
MSDHPGPIRWPARIDLARTPTPIEPLRRLSARAGAEIFVKRDDLTGVALTGNKVRKLEFSLAAAIEAGADTVFTCGGVQSNHARATALAAARLGLRARLFLRGTPPEVPEGNLLLDLLAGAEVEYVTPEEYRTIDARMADRAARQSPPAFAIPEGASDAQGCLGLARAVPEVLAAERDLGLRFDAVVHATGSGGTTAGLLLGARAFGLRADVFGVNVCDDEPFFVRKVGRILGEACDRFAPSLALGPGDVRILDGHVGPGYARNEPEDFATIRLLAREEGIVLDPVYTGKAMKGLLRELDGGRLAGRRRILFWHTGGIFGLMPSGREFAAQS